MYRQQLEIIFTPIPISTPRTRSRDGPSFRFSPTPIPRSNSTIEPLPVDVDELEKLD